MSTTREAKADLDCWQQIAEVLARCPWIEIIEIEPALPRVKEAIERDREARTRLADDPEFVFGKLE